MKKLFTLTLTFCFNCALFAQSPLLYSTGQGLISTRIEQITFDKDNFLWVCTNQGISCFDGRNFTNYSRNAGNEHALQENQVTCIYEDSNGMHWVAGSDALYKMNHEKNSLERYVLDSMRWNTSISRIVPHPFQPNSLLIGTYGYGIYVFDNEQQTVDRKSTFQLGSQLKRWNCQALKTDSHNRLWIANPKGIQCIDLEKMQRIDLPCGEMEEKEMVVHDMAEDRRHDCLYLATLNRGLLCLNLSTLEMNAIDNAVLNKCNITALAISAEGDLLVGTESGGLWNVHNGQASRITVEDCPVDLDQVKIHSIAFDKQENLWLGLYQKGVLMVPKQQKLFTCRAIKEKDKIHNLGNIATFACMSDGSHLFGIDGAGLLHEKKDGSTLHLDIWNSELLTNAILSAAALPNGSAYIGTYNYGLYLYDGKKLARDPYLNLLERHSIMTMVHDSLTHTLYIGTNGDGIYTYNTTTHQLDHLTGERHMSWIVSLALDRRHRLWVSTEGSLCCFDLDLGKRIVPPYRQALRAYNCAEDSNGTLWFATDHGLIYYGVGNDSLCNVQADNEPLNEEYFSLLQSKDGRIWLPSNKGITCYDPRRKTATRYLDSEIAQMGSFSGRAAVRWSDDMFAFGGDNGILEFSPEAIYDYRRTLQPIQFTRLWVNNVPTDYDPNLPADKNVMDAALWKATKLHLPHTSNSFALSFSTQGFDSPLGIRYFYHLDGFDNDWHEVLGQDLTAVYSTLPWGEYKLQVKAVLNSNSEQQQTTIKELNIEIDAPWYATGWALLLYLLLFASIVCYITQTIRQRTLERRLVRQAEHNRQIKEAKLRMFTSVSHEIKTPLTLIISPLRRLMQRNNDNATQSVYEMMYRNCLRILMLVTQQMDIRRIDNGQMHLHVSKISLQSFLNDLMKYFSDSALQHQIDFQLIIPEEDEGLMIWIDTEQLDKVFANLLSNAFKYVNDGGKVHLIVKANQANQTVAIEVYNSGSHLDMQDPRILFERFGTNGGSNLGLSLANELTEMHHGTLSAQNEKEGVSFCVTLKLGDEHFTLEEKRPITRIAAPTDQEQLEMEACVSQEDNSQPTDTDGRELIEMLSDELHEKLRLRERRSNLNFNYKEKELSSADEKLLNRVSDCISKNMSDPEFGVDSLAEQIGISRVHLNRKLRELVDTSPSALIKNTRLKQAAFLLVQNHVTIAEVAYSVGFSSPAYFSSNFSSYFNMTPKDFINTYTEDPENPELKKLLE